MKKIIKILVIAIILLGTIKSISVNAETSNFYKGEKISGIYMMAYNPNTKIGIYQVARFIREQNTNKIAYCIDPYDWFYDTSTYNRETPNMNAILLDRIEKIAHYGYGYGNHTDSSWYAVTQAMIWKEVAGDENIYFTDTLNGNKINSYDNMINEINTIINQNEKTPNIPNNIVLVEDEEKTITDTNNVLGNYNSTSHIEIQGNNLIIKGLKPGEYNENLIRKDNIYDEPILFYTSVDSQNVVKLGNLESKNSKLNIKVINTEINIKKIDLDTKTNKPSGEAKIEGTEFSIIDEKNNIIKSFKTDETGSYKLNNLPLGKYTLIEEKPGIGYKKSDKTIEFELSEENNKKEIEFSNEIIKKKIKIIKTYGTKEKQIKEPNIEFNVYDKNNNLVKTIKTNNEGEAEIILPYGNYTIKQLTTTEGYEFSNPINIKVENEEEETYTLKDYKINVPNTKLSLKDFIIFLFQNIII